MNALLTLCLIAALITVILMLAVMLVSGYKSQEERDNGQDN